MAAAAPSATPARHRPRITTVIVAAFVAGAAAAVGVNRALDVHLAQAKPQVECEPIFVALRSLPQGVPVTVWDVALRDWPKAMLPATALRAADSFEGCVLKYPLREGQPLLTAQLIPPAVAPAGASATEAPKGLVDEAFVPPPPALEPPAATIAAQAPPAAPVRPDVAGAGPADSQPADTEPQDTSAAAAEPQAPVAAVAAPPQATESPLVDQPTLASPAAEASVSETDPAPLTAPVVSAPQPILDRRLPGDADSPLDVPSRPPVDLASIPSVMSRSDAAAAPAAETDGGIPSSVRYLVVPERIARQADTSFTTPTAPETQAASEPAQAAVGASPPSATSQPRTRQAQSRQPQTQSRQPQAKTRPPQSRPPQPPSKPQRKPGDGDQAEARSWGGMFPNVAAGLDSWRSRSRDAAVPGQAPPSSGSRR